jgi:hypothetical protein
LGAKIHKSTRLLEGRDAAIRIKIQGIVNIYKRGCTPTRAPKRPIPPLIDFFKDIKDPWVDRHKKYMLLDIIVITLLAVVCGAEGWEDIERFGIAKKVWLKKFLFLERGYPGTEASSA